MLTSLQLEQDLLSSIPAWEAETGQVFLVHGMSMLQFLEDTIGLNDKENGNKRAKGRAGSVPPRAKTPANGSNHLVLPTSGNGGRSGVVTPAVRPSSSLSSSQSVPNKRPRLGDSASSNMNARAPLGNSRGPASINRSSSPTKIPLPGKTPTAIGSSLPRPVTLAMPVPKPGTVHHALGHGRVPSAQGGYHQPYQVAHRAASYVAPSAYGTGRYGAQPGATVAAKKATRARRESFKPRPSVDENWAAEAGLGGRRWAGLAGASVKEEDEY